jgi:hypothetical protein
MTDGLRILQINYRLCLSLQGTSTMISTKRRAPSSVSVPKTIVEQANVTLRDLPDKPKEELSLKEAMERMHDYITAALVKGYSLEEVADLLSNEGVDINVPSLKYYVSRINRQKSAATKPRTKKPRRKKEAIASPTEFGEAEAEIETVPSQSIEAAISPEMTAQFRADESSQPEETVAEEAPAKAAKAPAKKRPRPTSTPATRSKTDEKAGTKAAAKSKTPARSTSARSRRTKKSTSE